MFQSGNLKNDLIKNMNQLNYVNRSIECGYGQGSGSNEVGELDLSGTIALCSMLKQFYYNNGVTNVRFYDEYGDIYYYTPLSQISNLRALIEALPYNTFSDYNATIYTDVYTATGRDVLYSLDGLIADMPVLDLTDMSNVAVSSDTLTTLKVANISSFGVIRNTLANCRGITTLEIDGVNSCTDIAQSMSELRNIINLSINNVNVDTINYMSWNNINRNIENVVFNNWDTSNYSSSPQTVYNSIFSNCTNLTEVSLINIINWLNDMSPTISNKNISNVTGFTNDQMNFITNESSLTNVLDEMIYTKGWSL